MTHLNAILDMLQQTLPYWGLFLAALILSLILTPFVRELNRKMGMVDNPGGRRINATPIPRGGGVAVILAFALSTAAFVLFTDKPISTAIQDSAYWRMLLLSLGIGAIGFYDDLFEMKPVVKLLGQIVLATLAFFWGHVGFHFFFPSIPLWVDLPLTVFWIVGAINAFNLIDGLDGLASGLAVIAAVGMAGSMFFVGSPGQILLHLAFIGSVLGFLRYNFNPASVFLGDTGSMFLGFFLSTVPLLTRAGDSFLVGIGVPLLAMGVPIFDTSLAIIRRTVRAVLNGRDTAPGESSRVMQADSDHLHHRLLRKFVSQRKTAGLLYGFAAFLVLVGLGGVALRDRAAALFIVAFIVGTVVVVRDMSRVEIWDAGRLADAVAHSHTSQSRRRRAAFSVPLLILADILILSVTWYVTLVVLKIRPTPQSFHTFLPLRVVPVFFALVAFRSYSTVWARAMLSNYIRLILAVTLGVLGSMVIIVLLGYNEGRTLAFPVIHFGLSLLLLMAVRSIRPFLRDYFYFVNARRLADDPEVSRVLVFGAGLRYRSFRRELVRKFLQEKRVIVGLVDDDILLRGKIIGGIRVDGPHMDARRIVAETRADAVVIACELPPERLRTVIETFKSCGVKVSHFNFSEQPL